MLDKLTLLPEGPNRRVSIDGLAKVAKEGLSGFSLNPRCLPLGRNRVLVEPDCRQDHDWEEEENPGDDGSSHAKDRQQIVQAHVACPNLKDHRAFNDTEVLTEATDHSAEGSRVKVGVHWCIQSAVDHVIVQFFRPCDRIVGKRDHAKVDHYALPEEHKEVDAAIVSKFRVLFWRRGPLTNEVVSAHLEDDEADQREVRNEKLCESTCIPHVPLVGGEIYFRGFLGLTCRDLAEHFLLVLPSIANSD